MAEWSFLGEGGAHVVLKSSLNPDRVLRIRKGEDSDRVSKLDGLAKQYHDFVVKQLLAPRYLVQMEHTQLAPGFIGSLQLERPDFRLNTRLSPRLTTGHFLENLLTHTQYRCSVEIKPKWGLSCSPERPCKFCRLQHTKRYELTSYCPAKFFGDDLEGALEALWQSPRNQLRVWGDASGLATKEIVASILDKDPFLSILSESQRSLFEIYKDAPLSPIEDMAYLEQLEADLKANKLSSLSAFLTSIAIEDCSFMVSFNSPTDYRIKVIDVDIKLPSKLTHYVAEHDYFRRLDPPPNLPSPRDQ